MPYVPNGWQPGDPKPGWMRRRDWREYQCQRIFGHDAETMIGVGIIALGGFFAGIAVTAGFRDGWSFNQVSWGIALTVLPIGFGLMLIPKRKGD